MTTLLPARRLGVLLVAALVARPFATDACLSSDEVILLEPAANAVSVPTDVELWLGGGVTMPGRSLTLESADGVEVSFTIRRVFDAAVPSPSYLLRPTAPLRARLRHTLKARVEGAPDATRTWSFETGEGPVAGAPPVIGMGLVQAVNPVIRSTCEYSSYACVGLSYRGIVDVELRRRCDGELVDHILLRTTEGGLLVGYNGQAMRVPFCATLRARRANGVLGPAATFCTDPATTAVVAGNCSARCVGGSVWLGGQLLRPPPDDVAPDTCLTQSHITAAQWAEAVRSLRTPDPDASCLGVDAPVDDASVTDASAPDDAGRTDPDARDGAVPPVDAPAGGAGCRAAPARTSSAGAWVGLVALAVLRAGRRARRV